MLDRAQTTVEEVAHIGHTMCEVDRALRSCEPQVDAGQGLGPSQSQEEALVERAVIPCADDGAKRNAASLQRAHETLRTGKGANEAQPCAGEMVPRAESPSDSKRRATP